MHLNRTAEAGALSASFAYELSQPLVDAMLNAETVERLLTANLPEWARAKAVIADTQQAIGHAGEIIQHLKKLLKRSNEPLLQEFNLNEAIADALCMLSPEAAKRRITLSANGIQQTLPVRADRIHIQQVVLNLATNAMDAMTGSAPDARAITIQTSLREGSQVEVSVTDPEHKLSKVFDTFYTTKKEGTGLGLSIADHRRELRRTDLGGESDRGVRYFALRFRYCARRQRLCLRKARWPAHLTDGTSTC